jgi:Tetratricopeptide repeat
VADTAGPGLGHVSEAADTYRVLAAGRPDAFRPSLVASLNNLSNALADLGRRQEALAAIQEAVTVCRVLAAARPDAFGPNLAMPLTNLAVRLGETRHFQAAAPLAGASRRTVSRPP